MYFFVESLKFIRLHKVLIVLISYVFPLIKIANRIKNEKVD